MDTWLPHPALLKPFASQRHKHLVPQLSISPTVIRCSIQSSFLSSLRFSLTPGDRFEVAPKSHSPAMDALRSADAHVAAATHPRGNARWRLQRYNPLARLRWQKNRVAHPVAHQRAHTRARMNSLNPLFYLRRIRNNLSGVGRRRHTTHVI